MNGTGADVNVVPAEAKVPCPHCGTAEMRFVVVSVDAAPRNYCDSPSVPRANNGNEHPTSPVRPGDTIQALQVRVCLSGSFSGNRPSCPC